MLDKECLFLTINKTKMKIKKILMKKETLFKLENLKTLRNKPIKKP
jgi:hypothetical protein